MKKRKKILCGIIMTAAALFITGCGESETVINEPLSEVTKAVLNCGTYFPEMVEVNEENFTYEYGLKQRTLRSIPFIGQAPAETLMKSAL